jgi:putative Mg2+ transporter-C (MgtC) family protein
MDIYSSDFWIKIGVTVLCGSIIGLERQFKGKPSGIRTSIFICLGTNIFITLCRTHTTEPSEIMRVLGQVVSGIGFLGAGVIISRGDLVRGITSASVIWVLSGIGAMVGFGHYPEAIAIALLTVFLLIGIGLLENTFGFFKRGIHSSKEQSAGTIPGKSTKDIIQPFEETD